MNIQDTLTTLATYFVTVGFVYLASWMSGVTMDSLVGWVAMGMSLVGWVAMGMAASAGAKR